MEKVIEAVLAFDPVAEAEEAAERGETDDPMGDALALQIARGDTLRSLADATGDSCYGSNFEAYLELALSLGFNQVLREPFLGRSRDGEPPPQEHLCLLHHPEGVLLRVESYGGAGVNSAELYYNWRPHSSTGWDEVNGLRGSGGFVMPDGSRIPHPMPKPSVPNDFVQVGHCDAREFLNYKVQKRRQLGTFLPKWVGCPFLWLLNYMDSEPEGYDREAINARRIAKLPPETQAMLSCPES